MGRVCSWRHGYFIDNPVRRWVHNPEKLFGAYVDPGMKVLDLGCGMGFTSLAMARMVGETGRVISVDLQREMLDVLEKRAANAGLDGRIQTHRCAAGSIGVEAPVDFALAFYMVHEVPDRRAFLSQVRDCLKPGAHFLVIEPAFHVPEVAFQETLGEARNLGLRLTAQPKVRFSKTALFTR